MKRWMVGLVVPLVIVVVVAAAYLGGQSVQDGPIAEVQPSTVEVTRGDVLTTVTAPGHLVHGQETALSFEVGGTLAEVAVRPGETVEPGDILARLDATRLLEQVTEAQIDLELAQVLLDEVRAGASAAQLAAARFGLAQAQFALAELEAGPSAAELAACKAEVAAAEAELQRLLALPDPGGVAQAQAGLDRATMILQQAQAAYDAVQHRPNVAMLPQSLALQQATIDRDAARASLAATSRQPSPATLEAAEARLAAAQAHLAWVESGSSAGELDVARLRVAMAEAELAELSAGPRPAEIQQAESSVRAAELALARAQTDFQAATLTASSAGTILEVSASLGEMIAAGRGVIRLADGCALEVETSVIEEDLPLVQVGQEVILYFDAQPDAEVRGRVARLVPLRVVGDRPLYPVFIAAEEWPAGLLAGMTVDASIVIDSRDGVLRLPRALVRSRSDGTATLRVWTGTGAQERSVHTGLRGDAYVEILEGLSAGEKVLAQ